MNEPSVWARLRRSAAPLSVDRDTWVQRMMRWHFNDDTGSPFWLNQRSDLGFDPIRDVTGAADLALFGLFDKTVLRTVDVRDLVPRGFSGRPFRVFETGGSTGDPCRIADVTTCSYNVAMYLAMLEVRGVPRGPLVGMTPTGPHSYGTFVARLAEAWGTHALFIDFDPRWVKQLVSDGDDPDPYVAHLVAQTIALLQTQRPTALFTTSRLLAELLLAIKGPIADFGVAAVCTGGTSCSAEERRLIRHQLSGVQWIDTYGNTLMGNALQVDHADGHCSYHVPPPFAWVDVVDPSDWTRRFAYGERGQVLVHTLLEDLLLPNLLERDAATLTPPNTWFPWDGVRDVGPLQSTGFDAIEGVY